MKTFIAFGFFVALSAGMVGIAVAKEHYRENSVKADTKEVFEQLADNIRREMSPGGKYEYIKPD